MRSGDGDTIRTLEDTDGVKWPAGVCVYATTVGTPDVLQVVTLTAGLPVQPMTGATWAATQSGTWNIGTLTTITNAVTISDGGSSITVDGTVAVSGTVTVTGTGGTFPVTDSGGSLTVDAPVGTPVFVRLSDGASAISTLAVSLASVPSHDVTNAGTFAVQAAQSGTWNITNISGTVSLPTGASTAAKQPALGTAGTASADVITIQGVASMTAVQVADNGSSLTIDNAALSVTGGGVEASALRVTIASDSTGVLSVDDNGGSLTVDGTVAATQSGTWNVTDISGTVSLPTGASTSAKQDSQTALLTTIDADTSQISAAIRAEDSAHSSGDLGLMALAVRSDTAQGLAADNDYVPLIVDSTGRLWCNVSNTVTVASHAVTNAGTFAVQVTGDALTALQLIDDVVYQEDVAHTTADKGIQVLAVRRDTASALGADNDYTPPTTNARAALWVAIENGAGAQVTSFGGGTEYTEGDTDASITGTAAMWEDTSDTLRAISMAKPLPVQPGTSVAFPITDNGGSITVDGTLAVTGTVTAADAPAVAAGSLQAGTTPLQLSSSSVPCSWVLVQNWDSAIIAVGIGATSAAVVYASLGSSSALGIHLLKRQTLFLRVSNLNLVWVDAASSTTQVTFIYG